MKVATVLYSEFLYVKKARGYNQLLQTGICCALHSTSGF